MSGEGRVQASRLPSGEWRCIVDHRTEPCGECGGCREVQGINANQVAAPSGSEPCCEYGPPGHSEQDHHDASPCYDLDCPLDHPRGGTYRHPCDRTGRLEPRQ